MQALVLLTGFLGSGKTTALRELALLLREHSQDLQLNAILNDYRNAAIDSAIVQDAVNTLISISGSCVCCESRDELFDSLAELPRQEPGLILVEANGGADPIELLELISFDPRCQHLKNPLVLTLIHAKRWQKRLFRRGLEREQLRPATHYLLTHQDEATPDRLAQVRREILRINPSAQETSLQDFAEQIHQLAQSLQGQEPPQAEQKPTENGLIPLQEHFPGHQHTHPFASLNLPLPKQVSKSALTQFLKQLPAEVLRAKALVRQKPETSQNSEEAKLAVVQYMDDGMIFWMDIETEVESQPTLVLIGPELDEASLQKQLKEALQAVEGIKA